MGRTLQTSSDIGGKSNSINKVGTYHCSIIQSSDGESTTGKPMDGCSFVLSVLDGTEKDQIEKEFRLHLFDPDMSKDEAQQEWPLKKQTAMAVAINQVDPSKLGEAAQVDFDNAAGQQVIITIGNGQSKDSNAKWVTDPTKFDLSYANIFHVDDPRAKEFPKSSEALAILPAEMRKKAAYFSALTAKANPPAMAPKLSDDDLDTL